MPVVDQKTRVDRANLIAKNATMVYSYYTIVFYFGGIIWRSKNYQRLWLEGI